jgi:hypothetical protein
MKYSLTEKIEKEDLFFNKDVYLSFSGLSKLIRTPILYYNHYILNEREDKQEQAMIEGKLLHCLLLTPERFEEEYIIALSDTPSENPRKVIDTVFNHYLELENDDREELSDFGNAILDVLVDMNLYQSLKTDAQRIDKITTVQKNLDYWNYLKTSKDKTLINQDTYDFISESVEKIKSNSQIMQTMGFIKDFMDNIEVYNEIELECNTQYCYKLRGIIDNLVIDHDKKVIRINDLKKTSKHITDFVDSIDFYQYWMQLCIYYLLVVKNKNFYKYYAEGYNVELRFIVIDLFKQIGMYKISNDTLTSWYSRTEKALQIGHNYLSNRYFDLPYKFINGECEL